MKKLIILVFALTTALSFSALAQTPPATLDIENGVTATVGSTAYVPVYADFSGIPGGGAGAFTLYIDFDETVLTFTGIANSALTGVSGVEWTPGQILLTWTNVGTPSPLDDKLLDLTFTAPAAGGPWPLTFYYSQTFPAPSGFSSVGDSNSDPYLAVFTDGDVTFNAAVPLKNWALFVGLGLIIAFVVVRFRRLV